MPYAIFFNEGKAIHGFAGSVGGPASHGCVRLSTGNAKTLFRLVRSGKA
jgi:lipoprotein-anchoring transpeptidase ErfK/SrfK